MLDMLSLKNCCGVKLRFTLLIIVVISILLYSTTYLRAKDSLANGRYHDLSKIVSEVVEFAVHSNSSIKKIPSATKTTTIPAHRKTNSIKRLLVDVKKITATTTTPHLIREDTLKSVNVSPASASAVPKDEFPYDVPDANKLDLKFIHAPKGGICKGLEIVLLVPSAVKKVEQRQVIRKTWASKQDTDKTVKAVFLLGLPTTNIEKTNLEISEEAKNHGDIVQGSFNDAYLNLTVKSLVGLKWITESCREATFVVFSDDDVYVNMMILQSHVKKASTTGLLQCALEVHRNVYVKRDGKWALPVNRYSNKMWPTYCSGPCYMMSQDVARILYTTSRQMPADIGVADSYITGVLRDEAGVSISPEVGGMCQHLETSANIIQKLEKAYQQHG